MKTIQIFKPGRHTSSSGQSLSFSETDLKASCDAYDPARHEAPIVIGHPKENAPAYGWVKGLSFADGIEAIPHQVDPAFAEMVANGRYKKISASFYGPDSPSNPVPGVYYLRHVGFLGAQPPAVKGLRSPEFADGEQGVVEFGDYGDSIVAMLMRRFRDWLISEKGLDVADNTIPDYAVSTLEQMANQPDPDDTPSTPQYTETKGDIMSDADKARLAALEEENKRLKTEQAARRIAEINAGNAAFAEGLIKEGRLLPAQKGALVAALNFLDGQESVIEFSDGDSKKPISSGLKDVFTKLPKQVEFKEVAGGKSVTGEMDAATLGKLAADFMEAEAEKGRSVSSAEAVQYVLNSQGR